MADAMRRVQPKHKGYVLARASGMSPADAWTETQTNALQPERSGRRLEESPIIKAAIARSEEVVLRGSLMSAAQRRDWVLDRTIEHEASDADPFLVLSDSDTAASEGESGAV